ncbi:MAG: Holliday junction branch migration protein RuvA [Eubacterium sp.]|nr:Holliday junction branch migration protein RuvA [Eubacterium sp.]
MIAFIKGNIEDITTDTVIVDCNGVGYEIFLPEYVMRKLGSINSFVKIVTYLDVKEDSMKLYGFLSVQEKTLFKQLLTVSGIGPKGAMSILNELGPDNLVAAIISSDSKAISKANGIGLKTAQKVVLELKDKVSLEGSIFDQSDYDLDMDKGDVSNDISIAAQALVSLGYSNSEALKAIRKIDGANQMNTNDLIKEALKHL